jgi:hypothetical protein
MTIIRNIFASIALAGAVLMFVSAAIGVCEMLRGDYRQ